MLGLLPLGGTESLLWVGAHIQKRIQYVVGLQRDFRSFLCKSRRGYDHVSSYIYKNSSIRLFPQRTNPVWTYSNCSLETEATGIIFSIFVCAAVSDN